MEVVSLQVMAELCKRAKAVRKTQRYDLITRYISYIIDNDGRIETAAMLSMSVARFLVRIAASDL